MSSWVGFNLATGFSVAGTLFMTVGAMVRSSLIVRLFFLLEPTLSTKHATLLLNCCARLDLIILLLCLLEIMTCWAVQKHERYAAIAAANDSNVFPNPRTPILPYMDIRPPAFLVEALSK